MVEVGPNDSQSVDKKAEVSNWHRSNVGRGQNSFRSASID